VVNSEAQVQVQANFTVCALKFGSCTFVMGCTPNPAMCHIWSHVTWLDCGFGLPLGVEWRWGSLAVISNQFWTKTYRIFHGPLCYCRMTMISLFKVTGSKRWKN